jgi:hypothetical protein
MSVLTFSPWVMLALILSFLLVIVLVAFSRRAAENILRFCAGLLDLYQSWQQGTARSSLPEQNAKQHNSSTSEKATLLYNSSRILPESRQQGRRASKTTREEC